MPLHKWHLQWNSSQTSTPPHGTHSITNHALYRCPTYFSVQSVNCPAWPRHKLCLYWFLIACFVETCTYSAQPSHFLNITSHVMHWYKLSLSLARGIIFLHQILYPSTIKSIFTGGVKIFKASYCSFAAKYFQNLPVFPTNCSLSAKIIIGTRAMIFTPAHSTPSQLKIFKLFTWNYWHPYQRYGKPWHSLPNLT